MADTDGKDGKDEKKPDAGGEGGAKDEKKLDPADEADIALIKEVLDVGDDEAKELHSGLRTRWRKEARRWEKRAKENYENKFGIPFAEVEEAVRRYKEGGKDGDKGKGDDEASRKAAERATKAEGELLRLRVAMRKGLTETQAKRLIGNTEEELEDDADDLLATFKPKGEGEGQNGDGQQRNGSDRQRRPAESLRPAARTGARRTSGDDDDPMPSKEEIAKIADKVQANRF